MPHPTAPDRTKPQRYATDPTAPIRTLTIQTSTVHTATVRDIPHLTLCIYSLFKETFLNTTTPNTIMDLECKKCGYKWNYEGNKKVSATCPDCRGMVKIQL